MIPHPGDTLPNGRTLVAIRPIRKARPDEEGNLYAVLCLNAELDHGAPYAVWVYVDGSRMPPPRMTHEAYFASFDHAIADWKERSL